MKQIPLSRGLFALVDDEDYERVSGLNWRVDDHGYAKAYLPRGRGKYTRMHRLVLSAPKGKVIDHINGDKLDNRRENLRVCEIWQNTRNSKLRSNNQSGFRGVSYVKQERKWVARVWFQHKCFRLGKFKDIHAAAAAYDAKARECFGEFAVLNFPEAVGAASQERPEQHGQLALAARSEGHRVR